MKILHVNLVFDPGDTARGLIARHATLSTLAERQAAAGAQVTVAQRFSSDESFDAAGVRYEMRHEPAAGRGRAWTVAPRLTRLARELAPDVVHLHGLTFALQARALATTLPARTALVVQDHGSKPWGARRMPALRRALLANAHGILLNAAQMGEPLRKAGVLPSSVPTFEVRESSSTFRAIPRDEARDRTKLTGNPLILWVGRLQTTKDPRTVVDAFCRAAKSQPNAVLAMIYQAVDDLDALRALVHSHGECDKVKFLGSVPHDQLAAHYSAADLFVSASRWEGSNYALIEAMACGVWPVCSDNPSHRGLVGNVGHLFEVGNVESCQQVLDTALTASPTAWQARRAAVRARFNDSMSWDAIVQQSFDAYARVIALRRSPVLAAEAAQPEGEAFDGLAADYDQVFTATELGRRHRSAVWRRLDERFARGMRVLDLGCGTGEDACYLAERGVSVVATDSSGAMIQAACRKLAARGLSSTATAIQRSIDTINGDLGMFDGVMSNFGALNCVPLDTTAKVLKCTVKPGGFAVLVVMGPRSLWEWLWFLSHAQPRAAFRRARSGGANWRGLTVSYPSPDALTESLAPDFTLRRVSGVGTLLPPTFAQSLADRYPTIVDRLDRLERASETSWPIAGLADHYIAEFERVAQS